MPDLTVIPLHADHSDELTKLTTMANAADIGIMHHDGGMFEIDFPTLALDAECIKELCLAISNLRKRQHQIIELMSADLEQTAYASETGR